MGEVGPTSEICGNGLDDDCNGMPDDRCPTVVEVPVAIDGDCVTTRCPPSAPYPVGCNIRMAGDDPRGCVASMPMNSVVYFQEGDRCGAGRVTGGPTGSIMAVRAGSYSRIGKVSMMNLNNDMDRL